MEEKGRRKGKYFDGCRMGNGNTGKERKLRYGCLLYTSPVGRGEYPLQWGVAVGLVLGCAILLGVALIGLPSDSGFLLRTSYLANEPRILRTLTAEIVFLLILIGIYARRRAGR